MTKLKSGNLETESQLMYPEYFNIPGYQPIPRFYEENDGISITSQDMTMSIAEMVERYVKGEPVTGYPVYYDDNEENIAPQDFDLSDLTAAQAVINAQAIPIEDEVPSDSPTSETDTGQRPQDEPSEARRGRKAVPKSVPLADVDESEKPE